MSEKLYKLWCQICCKDTPQTCEDRGKDEIYTCTECGQVHSVRVR